MNKEKTIKSIMFFPNGNVAVFNSEGEQLSKFQGSYVLELIKKIQKSGFEVDETTEILLPNTNRAEYMPQYNNLETKTQ